MKKTCSFRKTVIIAAVSAVLAVALTLLSVYIVFSKFFPAINHLSAIDSLLTKYYYGEVDGEKIDEAVCSGYISALDDKYARYYSKADAKENDDYLDGYMSGLGMNIFIIPESKQFYVIDVYTDSPAEKSGIKKGDVICAVGDVAVNKDNYNDCYKSLKVSNGEKVKLTVNRGETSLDFSINAQKMTYQSVFYSVIDGYGYIKITIFNTATVTQFEDALNYMISKNVKGLIFDLSSNGGGTVDSVSDILDFLLPKGNILIVKYAGGNEKVLKKSDSREVNLPMAVLTSNSTASAAELFALNIRDYNKGILVGERTFGKGVMQNTYSLPGGTAVKFTVAKFYSKSKTEFNEEGITPDITPALSEYQQSHYLMLLPNENPYFTEAVKYLESR